MSFYTQQADEIKDNATQILCNLGLVDKIKKIGTLYYTGSYALDLMTWNDIDLQIVLPQGVNPMAALGDLFKEVSCNPDFLEAKIVHFKNNYKRKMPRGVYLNIKIDSPSLGGIWKIDVWVLDKEDFDKNISLLQELRSKMTPELREFILECKHAIMQGQDRMPQMSSHLLYQAILLEGMRDKKDLTAYFSAHNIEVSL